MVRRPSTKRFGSMLEVALGEFKQLRDWPDRAGSMLGTCRTSNTARERPRRRGRVPMRFVSMPLVVSARLLSVSLEGARGLPLRRAGEPDAD